MSDDKEVEGSDLSSTIQSELTNAQCLNQDRGANRIEYMRGEVNDIVARPNGSSQTDRTVPETVAWMLPGIIRVLTASDHMVEYEATQEGGEKYAEEASEYMNYSFFRENEGYLIIHSATHDSLVFGNGAVASYWEPSEIEKKLFSNKTVEEIAYLMSEEGWGPAGVLPKEGKSTKVEDQDPVSGEIVELELPTITVRLQKETKRGQIRDIVLKPENLFINSTATTIDDSRFCAYLHDDKTRSDLLLMADEYGWDKEVIRNLPADNLVRDSETSLARNDYNRDQTDSAPLKSGDLLGLYEVYMEADTTGDGIAELLQVWYVGDSGSGNVLSDEAWDMDVPFTDIPCYPVPHQWIAESVFDRTADIQRVKTVLMRQMLDNTYAVGMPMQEVEEGSVLNPDILVNPLHGGKIWKKKNSPPIVDHVVPYIGDKLLLAMEYMDEIASKRTGVSKTTMALDPDVLQNQTATASNNNKDAGQSQIELIVRNQAELGWTKVFSKRKRLAQKYIDYDIQIPSRNGDPQQIEQIEGQEDQDTGKPSNYRTIQPAKWSSDLACTINVGLGTGSRDRDMAMLSNVLNGQIGMADRLAAGGMASKAIEFIPKIRNSAVKVAESAGLKNPDEYYPEITDEEVLALQEAASQPQPNPAIELEKAKAEIQVQLKQMDIQAAQATKAQDLEYARAVEQLKAEGNQVKEAAQLQADLQVKEAERQNAILVEAGKREIEREKLALEREELDLQRQELFNKTAIDEQKIAVGYDIDMKKLAQDSAKTVADNQTKKKEKGEKDAGAKTTSDDSNSLAAAIGALAESQNLPKRVIRENDKVVGVETVPSGKIN